MIFHKAPVGSRNHKKVFYIEGQIVSQTVLAKLVSKRTALMCKPRSRVLLVNMKREQLNLSLALRQWKPAKQRANDIQRVQLSRKQLGDFSLYLPSPVEFNRVVQSLSGSLSILHQLFFGHKVHQEQTFFQVQWCKHRLLFYQLCKGSKCLAIYSNKTINQSVSLFTRASLQVH